MKIYTLGRRSIEIFSVSSHLKSVTLQTYLFSVDDKFPFNENVPRFPRNAIFIDNQTSSFQPDFINSWGVRGKVTTILANLTELITVIVFFWVKFL